MLCVMWGGRALAFSTITDDKIGSVVLCLGSTDRRGPKGGTQSACARDQQHRMGMGMGIHNFAMVNQDSDQSRAI